MLPFDALRRFELSDRHSYSRQSLNSIQKTLYLPYFVIIRCVVPLFSFALVFFRFSWTTVQDELRGLPIMLFGFESHHGGHERRVLRRGGGGGGGGQRLRKQSQQSTGDATCHDYNADHDHDRPRPPTRRTSNRHDSR